MKTIIYNSTTKYTRFYLKDPFTNKLERCTEEDFDAVITNHRILYDMYYENPNTQVFTQDGVIEGKRER